MIFVISFELLYGMATMRAAKGIEVRVQTMDLRIDLNYTILLILEVGCHYILFHLWYFHCKVVVSAFYHKK